MTAGGVVTFTHFGSQPAGASKDREEENQTVRGLNPGAKSTENGLFLASVTMPLAFIVDRAPQPEPPARNRHGHLVEMPARR